MDEFKIVYENLDLIERNLKNKDKEICRVQEKADRYKTILLEFLKSKIGQKIYWAHKNWRKYETHTISGVSVDIQKTDFFGEEYVGKECIRIYLEDGGYYIADDIGNVLFFSEGEAKFHACKSDKKEETSEDKREIMKCNNCSLRYHCDEQTEFICKNNDYCYMSE